MAVEQPVELPVEQAEETDRCTQCGQPIRGITTTRPATHVFIGCGHPASSHRL